MNQDDWISTGKAAAILGYSPGHFREKFEGLIPSYRINNGNRRWMKSAVEELKPVSKMPEAG